MQRPFIALLSFLLISTTVSAQKFGITWGQAAKAEKDVSTEVLGGSSVGYYIKKVINKEIFIERYDASNKLAFSRQIELPDGLNLEGSAVENVSFFKGRFLVQVSTYDAKAKLRKEFLCTYDPNAASMGNPLEIDRMPAESKSKCPAMDMCLSADSSKILLTRLDPYQKDSTQKILMKVIDESLNFIWSARVPFSFVGRRTELKSITVTNNAEAYFLAKDRKSSGEGYNWILYSYTEKSKGFSPMGISLDSLTISDAALKFDIKNNLVCAGFYETAAGNGINGTFFYKWDPISKKILLNTTKKFDDKFMTGIMSQNKTEKENGLKDLIVRNILFQPDGSSIMIAEQYQVKETGGMTGAAGSSALKTITYNFNDMVVADFNADGSTKWISFVPKIQTCTQAGLAADVQAAGISGVSGTIYSYAAAGTEVAAGKNKVGPLSFLGFNYLISPTHLALFFNDESDNVPFTGKDELKKLDSKEYKLVVAVYAAINLKDGTIKRTQLYNSKDTESFMFSTSSRPVSNNKMIIYSSNFKEEKFGTVTLK